MKRYLLIMISLLVAGVAEGQNGFNVPFSQFGIGESELPYNMPSVYGMGGVVYSRAARNTVNPFNPASYAAIEEESFVFDIGVNIQQSTLRKGDAKLADAAGDIAYLAIAFPLTKWWKTSVGIMPFSKLNYESVDSTFDPLSGSSVETIYSGGGGVTQVYWGNAFNITKNLSAGFNINYLFGNITRAITYNFVGNDTSYMMDKRSQKNTQVSNLLVDLGVQYRQPLNERYTLNTGFTCRLPRNMKVKDQSLVYTLVETTTDEYLIDTIFPARGADDIYNSSLEQPFTLGLGLALERNELWQVAVDAYYAPWSGLKYTENSDYSIFGQSALDYAPNWRVALGGEWMGDKNATSYWKRIGVRAGVYYNKGRLALDMTMNPTVGQKTALDEVGCGLGLALPMRKGRSVLNISLGYSSFGDIDLLRRNCFTVGLSVGSCERWFMKRKYN